jgi:hypothetical protein
MPQPTTLPRVPIKSTLNSGNAYSLLEFFGGAFRFDLKCLKTVFLPAIRISHKELDNVYS